MDRYKTLNFSKFLRKFGNSLTLQYEKLNFKRLGKEYLISILPKEVNESRLLFERSRNWRFFYLENWSNLIVPLKLFDERSRWVRSTSWKMELGIVPCIWFFSNWTSSIELGDWKLSIGPVSLYQWRSTKTKKGRVNNQDGTLP